MKLKLLKLVNFSGVKEFIFEPNGNNAEIIGDNDTGKTTIANAYYWLLFGTNAANTANFSPKPNDENGKPNHNLTTSVEGVFTLPNGSVSFRRDMEEEWVTKRGESEAVLKGNGFTYYIDETPVPKKEYDSRIAELIGPEREIKCASYPGYFAYKLDMKERRAVLFSLANFGDKSDYEIASEHPNLAEFTNAAVKPDGVNHYTVDEVRNKYKPLLKKANESLSAIPGRIDEAKRAIPETGPGNAADLDKTLQVLQVKKGEQEALLNSSQDEKVLVARRLLEERKTTIATARTDYNEKQSEEKRKHYERIRELDDSRYEREIQINIANSKIKTLTSEITGLEEQKVKLRKQYDDNRNSQFTGATEWKGESYCPLCMQELPVSEIEQKKTEFESMVKKQVEEFNLNKSKKVEEINKAGIDVANSIKVKTKEIDDFKASISRLESELDLINAQLQPLKESVQFIPFEQTDENAGMQQALEILQSSLDNATVSATANLDPVKDKIESIQGEINAIMQKTADYNAAEKQRKRVDELLAEEKQIAEEISRYKQILFQCDEFVKIKVAMITEQINSKFPTVRFKLFHEQLNEGIREICDIMALTNNGYQSYLSQDANEASRINADLEICGVMGEHFDIDLPIFLDGGESVTEPKPPEGRQFICLCVREGVKPLEIRIGGIA